MYARVTTSHDQPGKTDEGVDIYRDIMSLIKEKKGFKGAMLLNNSDTGKSISITLWDSEADMIATETSGWWKDQVKKFTNVMAGQPTKEHYEVSVHV